MRQIRFAVRSYLSKRQKPGTLRSFGCLFARFDGLAQSEEAMQRLSRFFLKRIELMPAGRQTVAHVFMARIRESMRGR